MVQESNSSNGQYIPLQYYTIITSLTAALVVFGWIGLTWYITKLTRNVLLHTTLLISLANTLPKLWESKHKMKNPSQFIIVFMVIVAIPLASMDVLLNLYADVYISVGGAEEFSKAWIDSLGPLSYLEQSSIATTTDATNTPNRAALASLLSKSVFIKEKPYDQPNSFLYDKSCDFVSNVLLNSAPSVAADAALYKISNSTFSSNVFAKLPLSSTDGSLVSAVWAMGPQVSPLFNGTPTNIMNLAHIIAATNNSAQFADTTAQFWLPIVGSDSVNATYVFSEGNRGRAINTSHWSRTDTVFGAPFKDVYDTDGSFAPPSNDSLTVRMVEVVDISFGRTNFTQGTALACFSYWYLDGQDGKCIVNLRRNADGTESYDVIVLLEPITEIKSGSRVLSPVSNLLPISSPSFVTYDQDAHTVAVSFATFCSNVLFYDSILCTERFRPFDQATNKNLGDNQLFLTTAYHYTVKIKSQSLLYYTNYSRNLGLTTSMVSALRPFSGRCDNFAGLGAKGLFTGKSYLTQNTAVVFISYGYMAFLCILFVVAFVLFWFNDQFLLPLRYIGQPFNGLSGDVILEKSWIGVAEHERLGWQVEVLSLTTTHKKTITCSSFTQADKLRKQKIQEDLDSGRAEDPKDIIVVSH